MAHIAVFCDGTWNSPDADTSTHVLRFARSCAQTAEQKVFYFPGVGTGTNLSSRIGRWIATMGGGLFGWGLNRNIASAYLALCKVYQPGDKIMIFGFSRGAYTARSLTGMIRKCGILEHPTRDNLRRAFRLYRKRGDGYRPDAPHVWAARRALSPRFATSQADVMARKDDSYLVRITYLGVWDTVGALGIPQRILGRVARLWNARYEFHDTALTRLVEQARHAVALDEKRILFEPSLWNNLDPHGDDPGLNRGDQSGSRPYQQVWFVGNHSIVGGATTARGLSAITARWIWEEAERLGLKLDVGARIPAADERPDMQIDTLYETRWAYKFAGRLLGWRSGPRTPRSLHDTVLERLVKRPEYRPHSLKWLLPEVFDRSE